MSKLMAGAMALMMLSLAGCLVDEGLADEPIAQTFFTWEGARIVGPPSDNQNNPTPLQDRPPRPACGEEDCERVPFTIPALPPGDVLVAIEWEGQDETYHYQNGPGGYLGSANLGLDLAIFKDGQMVVDGEESFHYAAVARLQDPAPGEYIAEVVARWGEGTYLGAARFVPQAEINGVPDAEGRLLPDLVMLPPDHIQVTAPVGHTVVPMLGPADTGCGPDETAEDQELRCLRFAGILGNQGPGDFLTVLEYEQAARSAITEGHWEQSILHADGSEERVRIGEAEYHEVHGHFHILDFVQTNLYTYDEDTGVRGEDTGFGRKTGFCIIDGGLIDPHRPMDLPKYHGMGCCYIVGICQLDMLSDDRFSMGMSAGWYDIYPWWRADQYVEISDLPDGVYELVSVINPAGAIHETTTQNNEASTVFRLTGDEVQMLEMRSQADSGPHPDADW